MKWRFMISICVSHSLPCKKKKQKRNKKEGNDNSNNYNNNNSTKKKEEEIYDILNGNNEKASGKDMLATFKEHHAS